MLTFDGTCPYCFKEVAFLGISVIPAEVSIFKVSKFPGEVVRVAVLAQCPNCYKPVIGIGGTYNFSEVQRYASSNEFHSILVERIIPPPSEPFSHVAIPEKVNEAFIEVQEAFKSAKKNYYLVISGCRTTVELAIKYLLKKDKVKLLEGIDELVERCIIPKPMGEWAHCIRSLGNESVHEAEGTKEEAEELLNFTRLFLEYVFVMPYKLNTFRKKRTA